MLVRKSVLLLVLERQILNTVLGGSLMSCEKAHRVFIRSSDKWSRKP